VTKGREEEGKFTVGQSVQKISTIQERDAGLVEEAYR
jgi:hypothetical protein